MAKSFFSLPPELRLLIYTELLVTPLRVRQSGLAETDLEARHPIIQLSLSCRRLSLEILPLLSSLATFSLHLSDPVFTASKTALRSQFLALCGPLFFAQHVVIVVTLQGPFDIESLMTSGLPTMYRFPVPLFRPWPVRKNMMPARQRIDVVVRCEVLFPVPAAALMTEWAPCPLYSVGSDPNPTARQLQNGRDTTLKLLNGWTAADVALAPRFRAYFANLRCLLEGKNNNKDGENDGDTTTKQESGEGKDDNDGLIPSSVRGTITITGEIPPWLEIAREDAAARRIWFRARQPTHTLESRKACGSEEVEEGRIVWTGSDMGFAVRTVKGEI